MPSRRAWITRRNSLTASSKKVDVRAGLAPLPTPPRVIPSSSYTNINSRSEPKPISAPPNLPSPKMAQPHSAPSDRRGAPNRAFTASTLSVNAISTTTSASVESSSPNCRRSILPVMERRLILNISRSLNSLTARVLSSWLSRPLCSETSAETSAQSSSRLRSEYSPGASSSAGNKFSCCTLRKSSHMNRLAPIISASVSRTPGDRNSRISEFQSGRARSCDKSELNCLNACSGSGAVGSRYVNCFINAAAART